MNSTTSIKNIMPVLLFGFFALALGIIFRYTLNDIAQSWQQEEYSHGYLIPPLSLLLLLNKLADVKFPVRTSWSGAIIVGVCIVAQILFQFAGVSGLLPQIFLIALIALVVLFWGQQSLRPLAGPLALLFFCAPLPKLFFYTLSFDMQMLSSSLGTNVLMLLGIPVFQDGNIIDLGGYQLQVAEACSGLRYLFPLIGLSFLLAYIYQAPLWKRAVIFASAAPISVLMNGLRIALIGITVDQWGSAMAEGMLHEFEGLVVFAGCVLCLFAEILILQKIGRSGLLHFEALRWPSFKNIPLPVFGKPTVLCAAFLMLGVIISVVLPPFLKDYLKPVPLQQSLTVFPLEVNGWEGRADKLDGKALDILGTTEYFVGDYAKGTMPSVNLYMLYYPQQDSLSNQGLHSPSVCIPGGGWTVEQKTKGTLTVKDGQSIDVNEMIIAKDGAHEIVTYWFVQDGTAIWSPNLSKFLQMKNAITKGRSDGAMIRLVTAINTNETTKDAENRLNIFAQDMLGTVNTFLGW